MILLKGKPVEVIRRESDSDLLVTVKMPNGEHRNYWPALLTGTERGLAEVLDANIEANHSKES